MRIGGIGIDFEGSVQVLTANDQLVIVIFAVLFDPCTEFDDLAAFDLSDYVGILPDMADAVGGISICVAVEGIEVAVRAAPVDGWGFAGNVFAGRSEDVRIVDPE